MSWLDKCKVEFLIETLTVKDISDTEYFSSKYKKYTSNSKLSLINPTQEGSPKKYEEGIQQSYNSSFEFGSAVHALLLQKEKFVLSDYDGKPTAKLGVFIDKIREFRKKGLNLIDSTLRASEKADYYKGKLSDKILKKAIVLGLPYYLEMLNGLYEDEFGREVIVLPRKALDDCKQCISVLRRNNKVFQAAFMNNFLDNNEFLNEYAIFIDIAITLPTGERVVIPFKLKADNIVINHEEKTITLNDLKTSGKPIAYFMGNLVPEIDDKGHKINEIWMDGSFQKYHYFRQIAVYMLVLQMYAKTRDLNGYSFKSNMMVVESYGEFKCDVFPVSASYIKEGMVEFKELICRVAFHELNGFDVELNEEEYE